MPSKLMYDREPFPPNPKPENNEDIFAKKQKQKLKAIEYKPLHLAQQEDPWNRLNVTPTLQSSRREIFHHDPLAPVDSLDFVLNAVYNQSTSLMQGKPAIVLQRETLGEDLGRRLKNREKVTAIMELPLEHPLRIVELGKMEDFNSVKLAIESHHTQITNRGYSRKPDGGYFST